MIIKSQNGYILGGLTGVPWNSKSKTYKDNIHLFSVK